VRFLINTSSAEFDLDNASSAEETNKPANTHIASGTFTLLLCSKINIIIIPKAVRFTRNYAMDLQYVSHICKLLFINKLFVPVKSWLYSRCTQKQIRVFMKVPIICPILTIIWACRNILVKFSSSKFHEKQFRRFWVVKCRRTDGHGKDNRRNSLYFRFEMSTQFLYFLW
jgi:hypothetical protein